MESRRKVIMRMTREVRVGVMGREVHKIKFMMDTLRNVYKYIIIQSLYLDIMKATSWTREEGERGTEWNCKECEIHLLTATFIGQSWGKKFVVQTGN